MNLPNGLSAQAIAGVGDNHPWDPSDLNRCVRYCERVGLSTSDLRVRMAGRSIYWDRLLPHWDRLVSLLKREIDNGTGYAQLTYRAMKCALDDGRECVGCSGTGQGSKCEKCRGSGRRSGGTCRAQGCDGGLMVCPMCRGAGYHKHARPNP